MRAIHVAQAADDVNVFLPATLVLAVSRGVKVCREEDVGGVAVDIDLFGTRPVNRFRASFEVLDRLPLDTV